MRVANEKALHILSYIIILYKQANAKKRGRALLEVLPELRADQLDVELIEQVRLPESEELRRKRVLVEDVLRSDHLKAAQSKGN